MNKILAAFAFVLCATLLWVVADAQTDPRPHEFGTAMLDYVVPYGASTCIDKTISAASDEIVASGTLAHLQLLGAYEITLQGGPCDLFFEEATAVASGTGNHLPANSKVVYRLYEKYLAAYCYTDTRVNLCPSWR